MSEFSSSGDASFFHVRILFTFHSCDIPSSCGTGKHFAFKKRSTLTLTHSIFLDEVPSAAFTHHEEKRLI
jgi:hypothetical protein